jgi:DNA anti-recombination protein RmuC
METLLLVAVLAGTLVLLGFSLVLLRRVSAASQVDVKAEVAGLLESHTAAIGRQVSAGTADMASRLEQTKGDLRQQVTDRIQQGFSEIRTSLDQQLSSGREEQNRSLADGRRELTSSLLLTTQRLQSEFQKLNQQTAQSLDAIRDRVDQKLMAITEQVQQKLDQNIKEGFAQFEKVQQHLKAAEEQLREVGALGHSINDLNNLLKLPHLRGQFGEASLERLLADFLPAHMFAMQSSPGEGGGRADAIIASCRSTPSFPASR